MKTIIFVCHGNICRSPMAEYILKNMTNNFNIISRATSREEIGNDMHRGTKEQLRIHNIPFDRHYAEQLTQDDYDKASLVICFDDYNIRNLKYMLNDDKKIIKLLDKDIDDPWYTGDFTTTYKEIYEGCIKLLEHLKQL